MHEAPPLPPIIPRRGESPPSPGAPWRQALWACCAFITVAPIGALGGFMATLVLEGFLRDTSLRDHGELIMLGLAVVLALAVTLPVIRAGLRSNWPADDRKLRGWVFGAAGMALLVVLGGIAFRAAGQHTKYLAMIPRQLASAADQYYLENGDTKVLIPYSDLVAPESYIKGYQSVDGENPADQFPILHGWGQVFEVRLPDGTTVKRQEVFASVGKSGLVATYPRPQEGTGTYDPKRVYRLSNGITFQGNRRVDLAPDPAGREGRDQDGVHVYNVEDLGRYEVTFRGGVADGPFRAYRSDGSLLVEATYERGRVVGPAWHHLRDGSRFDELAVTNEEARRLIQAVRRREKPQPAVIVDVRPGPEPSAPVRPAPISPTQVPVSTQVPRPVQPPRSQVSRIPARPVPMPPAVETPYLSGHRKYRAKDFAGALQDFSKAVEAEPAKAEGWQARGDARRMLGDSSGAIADYTAALEHSPDRYVATNSLRKRAHLRRLEGDLAGAAADFRLISDGATSPLWLYITECERGRGDEARRELAAALEPATDRKSPALREIYADIATLMLDRITLEQLEEKTAVQRQHPQVRFLMAYFAAMRSRISGDEAAAVAGFRQALFQTPPGFSEGFEVVAARQIMADFEARASSPKSP